MQSNFAFSSDFLSIVFTPNAHIIATVRQYKLVKMYTYCILTKLLRPIIPLTAKIAPNPLTKAAYFSIIILCLPHILLFYEKRNLLKGVES